MKTVNHLTLITGGCRSGKSRYALSLATPHALRAFIATAEAVDEEMAARIRQHRAERGTGYVTIEEPLNPAGALDRLPTGCEVVIIDCVTTWLANLMHRKGDSGRSFPEVDRLLEKLDHPAGRIIIVTNEVGAGIVPDNPLARRFRDLAGGLNQELARRADAVVCMIAGIPFALKGER